ncbi:hypothetical protein TNCT6_56060 [Streptomyces sp. 6-11-2]|nr:hypothetical protein TNCT6_56060 [Streptomyces sp. 6-11-2]
MTHATIPPRPAHPDNGRGRSLPVAADRAPKAFAEADAASALADGLRHGDALVAARGRSNVEPLVREGRL